MYVPLESYAQSKLAQMLFTNYVDAQMKAENAAVQVHSVHPGLVDTEIFEGQLFKKISPWLSRLFFKVNCYVTFWWVKFKNVLRIFRRRKKGLGRWCMRACRPLWKA